MSNGKIKGIRGKHKEKVNTMGLSIKTKFLLFVIMIRSDVRCIEEFLENIGDQSKVAIMNIIIT